MAAHRRAVNVRFDDGALLGILPEGAPLHPWALTAPVDPASFAVDDPAAVKDGALSLGEARIALAGAQSPDLRLTARPPALPGEAAIASIRSALSAAPRVDPFDRALAAALDRFRAGGAPADLASIVGLGRGLTPSGDDILVGVLGALDLLREARPEAPAIRAALAAALAAGPLAHTPRLSAQMIRAAVDGRYAEPVLGLLSAIGSAEPRSGSVNAALSELLALGHRSGRDSLHGILAGLDRLPATAR